MNKFTILNEDFWDNEESKETVAAPKEREIEINGGVDYQYLLMVSISVSNYHNKIDGQQDNAIALVPAFVKRLIYSLRCIREFKEVSDDYELYTRPTEPEKCDGQEIYNNGVIVNYPSSRTPYINPCFGIGIKVNFRIHSFTSYMHCLKVLSYINIAPYFSIMHYLFYEPDEPSGSNMRFGIYTSDWGNIKNILSGNDNRKWDTHPDRLNIYKHTTALCGSGSIQKIRDIIGKNDDNTNADLLLKEYLFYGKKSKKVLMNPKYTKPSDDTKFRMMLQYIFMQAEKKIYIINPLETSDTIVSRGIKSTEAFINFINDGGYDIRIKVFKDTEYDTLHAMYFLSKSVILSKEYDYVIVDELNKDVYTDNESAIADWLFPMVLCGNNENKLLRTIFPNLSGTQFENVKEFIKKNYEDGEWEVKWYE